MFEFNIYQINIFSKKEKKLKIFSCEKGFLSQFNGFRYSILKFGSFQEEKIYFSYNEKIPKNSIVSIILIERLNNILKEKNLKLYSIIYPNGIIVSNLQYLPKDFIFIKAQNGSNFIFKLKRDKIYEFKKEKAKIIKKTIEYRHPKKNFSKKGIFALGIKTNNYKKWPR